MSSASSPPKESGSVAQNVASREAKEKSDKQAKERKTCDKYVQKGLNRNVTVQFLLERLVSLGCTPPSGFIKCRDCGDKQAGGGFGVVEEIVEESVPLSSSPAAAVTSTKERGTVSSSSKSCVQQPSEINALLRAQREGKTQLKLLPEVFLCQQHLRDETHAHESMVHELIHAVDMCRTKMDPMNNCVHLACTEIRAENLSGECNMFRELSNGRVENFVGHGAKCVKRRAALSVKANPNCSDKAEDYVDAAFERCIRDTFPFDRHPNLR